MRFLIAPDKFKGSLTAREVAENIALGIRDVLPDAHIDIAPVADGGEGTAQLICEARDGEWKTCEAHDALSRTITARYAWLAASSVAIMDMSEAAGMSRIAPDERDVMRSSTFGVGEMVLAAIGQGAREIIIGLGGSATNDGGFGLARTIGFRFFPADGDELPNGPSELVLLERIQLPNGLRMPRFTAAADVRNPLLGLSGATRVFSGQKGATPDQMELLERALARLADVTARDLGVDHRGAAGAGAAGGLGFGLMTFCNATVVPGFDVVADAIDLESRIAAADIVITGEGKLDATTRDGKAPAGVARLARKYGKSIFAIVGSSQDDPGDLFDAVFVLARPPLTPMAATRQTAHLLRQRAAELARTYVRR